MLTRAITLTFSTVPAAKEGSGSKSSSGKNCKLKNPGTYSRSDICKYPVKKVNGGR
jgi:hypothetical protein